MQQVSPNTPGELEDTALCPNCETPGGYMLRIPRARWRHLLFLKDKHYLCRECGHKFYTKRPVKH